LSSRSAPGVSRRLNPFVPPSRKSRRHRSSSCTGTCVSRETVPSSSPFKSRSTISVFARALHRSGSSSPVCRSAPSIPVSSSRPSFPWLIPDPFWTPGFVSPNRCPRKTGAVYARLIRQEGPMRAALYCRVSKANGDQHPDNQVHELTAWAGRLGHELVHVYCDRQTGSTDDRQGLHQTLRAAHRREYDVSRCLVSG